MRILHTSDWHIGRQFHQVSLLEDQRHVLAQIIEICVSEKVDVVIIAGDIYDRAIPPANAVNLIDETFNHLCNELDIPVIVIAGNHDSPERLGFASRQLGKANLYISGALKENLEPVILHDKHGDVAFYPIPYADPAIVREVFFCETNDEEEREDLRTHDQCMSTIIQQITKPITKQTKFSHTRTVAISHCFLSGGSECDSERPLSVGGAEQVSVKHFKKFNYTALGHLHRQQSLGNERIGYSGSILKYSFSEEHHKKSVTLVDMDAQGQCEITSIPLTALRDMRSISGALEDIIAAAKSDPHCDDYLLISLTDTHAILDPMSKLRAVYPNVLHLERPGLMSRSKQKGVDRELIKQGGLSMFKDFYQQVKDEALTGEQEKLLIALLDELGEADQQGGL
ncbi:MAG: exonuclease SbcCD subunit D [Thiotrichaceae bacterium]